MIQLQKKRMKQIALFLLLCLVLAGCGRVGLTDPEPTPEAEPAVDYSGLLRISELMVKNKASVLAPAFPDWAELENCSGEALDLNGWQLTDRQGGTGLTLPEQSLEPDGVLLVPLDSGGFSLSPEETLYLVDPAGQAQDKALCQDTGADCSLIRQEDGGFAETPWISPGHKNNTAGYEAYAAERETPGELCIWEVMVSNEAHSVEHSLCDWVELRNNGAAPLALAGWTLSDDPDEPKRWAFPEQTLEPGGLLVIRCNEDDDVSQTNTGFSLNAVSEQLYLFDPAGTLADWVSLHEIPVEGSMGRSPEGTGFFYFTEPSPGMENAGGARRVSSKPAALTLPGVYEDTDSLRIELLSAGEIYYTTDGSLPTRESAHYEGPISVGQTCVIRAVALEEGAVPSRPASFSYIMNEGHTVPVLSLATDTPSRWLMIYNAALKGATVPVNLSFYDGKEEIFNQDGVWELAGWTSLSRAKKSMNVSFSGRYGGELSCDVFGNGAVPIDELSIRAGQDYTRAFFRNELCQALCLEASDAVYTQASRYCALYVNGQYWGLYNLKEGVTRQFYASHTGVSKDSVEANRCPVGTNTPFYPLVKLGWTGDMNDLDTYRYICEQIDMDSLIDWFLLEAYCANTDTQGNLRLYRSFEGDGRWDFVFYDLDWSFEWIGGSFYGMLTGVNNAGADIPPIIRNLSGNPEFRDKVFSRYAQLGRDVLSNEHVLELVDRFTATVEPEMERDTQRWNYSLSGWTKHVENLRGYFTDRDWIDFTTDQLLFTFHASDEEALRYFGRTAKYRNF